MRVCLFVCINTLSVCSGELMCCTAFVSCELLAQKGQEIGRPTHTKHERRTEPNLELFSDQICCCRSHDCHIEMSARRQSNGCCFAVRSALASLSFSLIIDFIRSMPVSGLVAAKRIAVASRAPRDRFVFHKARLCGPCVRTMCSLNGSKLPPLSLSFPSPLTNSNAISRHTYTTATTRHSLLTPRTER